MMEIQKSKGKNQNARMHCEADFVSRSNLVERQRGIAAPRQVGARNDRMET